MTTITYGHCEEREVLGGIQRIYRFENSRYSASVVCHEYSYSSPVGKWELAVLYNGKLCYTTPITDDVITNLSDDEVQKILAQIDTLRDPLI
tara:strand:- start:226 stop:501 length:276 start_codon:yes stop_codon:yes gene_type:complete